ncbi:hypothetical protein PILCRDRAFT_684233 [Piloderma croceum F 1598]|uniref:G domain-containing protein n=1 Tax=Piloderma croceum (strain F 1598) TaxID=765440 RepID=A0A0C3F5G5_PILCF|nr:hypothetical protein PILCRDRAFT_684233 [Piloderma croceum F 1598]
MHTSSSSPSLLANSDADDEQLRSYFDDTTKGCDVFRILPIGKVGSGKSTLVSEVFDFELDESSVQHYTCSDHDINREILSQNNKSLSLHDSKGLESGSAENLKTITDFIQDRKGRPFSEQLHAIWYCVEIPIAGQRPFEGGDIAFFNSLIESNNKVPVIVVFTKIDRLQFREQKRLKKIYIDRGMEAKPALAQAKTDCATEAAAAYQKSCVDVLQSDLIPAAWMKHCAVSNKHPDSIVQLIEVTKSTLVKSDALNILWASAQMADVDLKIEMSIKAGKNMYWQGLGAAMIPLKGLCRVTLLTVLSRIHSDIVRVWNINDPDKILVGANMRVMIRMLFVEPIMSPTLDGNPDPDSEASHIIKNLAQVAINPAGAVTSAVSELLKSIDNMAATTPATARVLMAYISDLTLGMESLYWLARARKDKAINRQEVVHAFTTYRASTQRRDVHMQIRDYIGDENIMRSFSRDKALTKVAAIVDQARFNPTEVFEPPQVQHGFAV